LPQHIPWFRYLSLNAVYLGSSFTWNSLHPIVLPLMLLDYGPEATKNTRLGLLTFAGLVLAMAAQPLFGALSDGTRHRLGRRRPWIIGGTAVALLALAGLALARRLWQVAAGYLLLQAASNAVCGPANALIPDEVPPLHRGLAAGLKNLLDMAGILLAAVATGRLLRAGGAGLDLLAIGALLAITAALTVAASAPGAAAGAPEAPATALRERLAVRRGAASGYGRLLVSRFWLLLATYLVQSFGLYYFRDVLALRDPAGAMGSLMTAIGIPLAVAALPAGVLSERWGRRSLSVAACALVAGALAGLLAVRDLAAIRALGAVVGLGMGIFVSVNWAWATDLVSPREAGKYLGLANLATAGPSALSRLMGPLVDVVNGWRANAGYRMLFVCGAAAAALALYLTLRVPETRGPHARRPAARPA